MRTVLHTVRVPSFTREDTGQASCGCLGAGLSSFRVEAGPALLAGKKTCSRLQGTAEGRVKIPRFQVEAK